MSKLVGGDPVRAWSAMNTTQALCEDLLEFNALICGPFHDPAEGFGGHERSGRMLAAFREFLQRDHAAVFLLPRKRFRVLTLGANGELVSPSDWDTRWPGYSHSATHGFLRHGAGISAVMEPKPLVEPIVAHPGLEAWRARHCSAQDRPEVTWASSLDAPRWASSYRFNLIAYENGDPIAVGLRTGRSYVALLPFNQHEPDVADVALLRRLVMGLLNLPRVLPLVAYLDVAGDYKNNVFRHEGDLHVGHIEPKSCAFLHAFLLESNRLRTERVPSRRVQMRLQAMGRFSTCDKIGAVRRAANDQFSRMLAGWDRTPYDLFRSDGETTWLTFPDQLFVAEPSELVPTDG